MPNVICVIFGSIRLGRRKKSTIIITKKLPAGLRINITGGESTIRKDIDDIFRVLYPKASLLELSTNGYNTETIVALAKKYP